MYFCMQNYLVLRSRNEGPRERGRAAGESRQGSSCRWMGYGVGTHMGAANAKGRQCALGTGSRDASPIRKARKHRPSIVVWETLMGPLRKCQTARQFTVDLEENFHPCLDYPNCHSAPLTPHMCQNRPEEVPFPKDDLNLACVD